VGRYKLLCLLFLPLYTRVKKENVLEHFVRGRIFGYIEANPGAHYSAIKGALGLSNGVLAYHIQVLEREGLLKSRQEGMYKYLYPTGAAISQDLKGPYYVYLDEQNKVKARNLSRFQHELLNLVRQKEGVTQKDVARSLGKSKQLISYHIRKLAKLGLLRRESQEDGTVRLFPNDPKQVQI